MGYATWSKLSAIINVWFQLLVSQNKGRKRIEKITPENNNRINSLKTDEYVVNESESLLKKY